MDPVRDEDPYGIGDDDPFPIVVDRLSSAIFDHVTSPYPLEKLKFGDHKDEIHSLVNGLASKAGNRKVMHALLCVKWYLSSLLLPADDQNALRDTRAHVCEIIAARFVMRLSDADAMEYCLHQLPDFCSKPSNKSRRSTVSDADDAQIDENSSLLPLSYQAAQAEDIRQSFDYRPHWNRSNEQNSIFVCSGLTALEIAVAAGAKHFLSRSKVQDIIHGVFDGTIIFHTANGIRIPRFYDRNTDSMVTRLKVPRYIKSFEAVFHLGLFILCYFVVSEEHGDRITPMETLLYVWIASLAHNEISRRADASALFYSLDIWNAWDQSIIVVGVASFLLRASGWLIQSSQVKNLAFDFVCIEALFLLPRMCSMMTLYPSFGVLFPCLQLMAKDFVKAMVISIILFSGFYASFTLLCQNSMSWQETCWLLTKVFFGGASGIDAMAKIASPLAQPLMLLFIICSKILLMTVILCILRDTYVKIISSAHDECVFVYSVFVLEASTTKNHEYFYPPFGLLPLVLLSPLQFVLSEESLETLRHTLLIITHVQVMVPIWLFENVRLFQNSTTKVRHGMESTKAPSNGDQMTAYNSLHLLWNPPKPAVENRSSRRMGTGSRDGRRKDTVEGEVV